MKGQKRIVCLTAYDKTFGALADQAGVDLVLVGDSLGNVVLGQGSTVAVTMDEMAHHVRATRQGVARALLVGDLPYGSYNSSTAQAVDNAVRLMKVGAEAVKLEGDYPEAVREIVRSGAPVMGHVGFTPQSVNQFGGFKVQGRHNPDAVLQTALALEAAGAFAIVLELVPAELAKRITESLTIPTIGIGAGIHCDGEIQVMHDILGLSEKPFKHSRRFSDVRKAVLRGFRGYGEAVRSGAFPSEENSF